MSTDGKAGRLEKLVGAAIDAAGDAEHALEKTAPRDRSNAEWATGVHLKAAVASLEAALVHAREIEDGGASDAG